MTRQLNAQCRALTEQELEQVSGGASQNLFGDHGQLSEKATGSANTTNGNVGTQFGGMGTFNDNIHYENKT